ncbi:MAG: hypothetical protein AAGC73_01950 [Verrucomicrobiota bacterium]
MFPRRFYVCSIAVLLGCLGFASAQDSGLLTIGDEPGVNDLILPPSTGDEDASILDTDIPNIRQSQTISGSLTEIGSGALENSSEEDYAKLLENFDGAAFEEEEAKKKEDAASNKDLLAFTLISFITDWLVSFIALSVILQLLGAHTKYLPLVGLAFISATVTSGVGYYLKILPPNLIGITASAIVLILLLSVLKGVRRFSTAIGGGLFTKIISGLAIWLISLAADALF